MVPVALRAPSTMPAPQPCSVLIPCFEVTNSETAGPAGAALENAREIHYNPDAPRPRKLILQIPAIYNSIQPVKMEIRNFPYSPSYFQSGDWQIGYKRDTSYGAKDKNKSVIEKGLVTKEPITLRLFPLSPARTNFNAVGAILVPARPIFDYGTPVK
jgi:hypothetical protein